MSLPSLHVSGISALMRSPVAPPPQEKRVYPFDALRGLAAFVVLLHHLALMMAFPTPSWGHRLTHLAPLKLFFAGHAAVLVFFVLSGFALSAMMQAPMGYLAYLLRRALRVMVPSAAALLLSTALYFEIQPHFPLPELSPWANAVLWTTPVTLDDLCRQIFLVGYGSSNSLDSVLWSLVYEMRISLVFPLLYALYRRWPRSTLATVLVLTLVLDNTLMAGRVQSYNGNTPAESLLLTVHYLPAFVLGIALYTARTPLVAKAAALKAPAVVLLAVGLYFLLTDKHDLLVGLGATGLLALALARPGFQKWLAWRPFTFLGTISYSLYLTHMIVIGTALQLWHADLSQSALALALLVAAPLTATLFYFLVERPAIGWSRRVTRPRGPPIADAT